LLARTTWAEQLQTSPRAAQTLTQQARQSQTINTLRAKVTFQALATLKMFLAQAQAKLSQVLRSQLQAKLAVQTQLAR